MLSATVTRNIRIDCMMIRLQTNMISDVNAILGCCNSHWLRDADNTVALCTACSLQRKWVCERHEAALDVRHQINHRFVSGPLLASFSVG